MVDKDGVFTYTNISIINFNSSAGLTIFPNPVKTTVNIEMNATQIRDNNCKILDVNGKIVKTIPVSSNVSHPISVDVSDLAKGFYIISAGNILKQFIKL